MFQSIADVFGVPLVVVLLAFRFAGIAAMAWMIHDLFVKPRQQ
jgi:hypothetical protein